METVIIVIHLMLVLALIGVVLLQKSEGGALGMGSGGGLMSSRGTANVLTRTTAILAAGFFATSVVLAILAGKSVEKPASIIDKAAPTAPATPAAPAAPAGSGGGILDTLQQMQKGGQPSPQKPAGQ